MERAEFVANLAKRMDITPEAAETGINATLAELVAPRIWGNDIGTHGFLDNNCTNNCKEK